MAFKGPSGYFYTELVLPGYGRLPRKGLGTKRKSDAIALENAIKEVYRRGLHDPHLFGILDALKGQGRGKPGLLTPADVLVAVRAADGAEEGLLRLIRSLDDPPLTEVVEAYLATGDATREDRLALATVLRYLTAGVRLSALTDASSVTALLRAVEAGAMPGDRPKQRNSVVRYERRAISKLLAYRFGQQERDRVMRAVRYEATDDRRRLRASVVTPAALGRLCDELDGGQWQAGDEAASLYVRIAVATGGEIRPLSETRNGDYQPLPGGQGMLLLRGTKKARHGLPRDRELRLPRALAAEVARFHRPGRPNERLFPLTFERFWTMFQKARKRAGLMEAVLDASGQPTPIRPHDFRRVYALRGREAGVPEETLGHAGLGHDNVGTTRTYIRAETAISAEEAEAIFATALKG